MRAARRARCPWPATSRRDRPCRRTTSQAARTERSRWRRALVLALHRVVLRVAHVLVREFGAVADPARDRVLHEVLVVAVRVVVRPRVRAPALLARDPPLQH